MKRDDHRLSSRFCRGPRGPHLRATYPWRQCKPKQTLGGTWPPRVGQDILHSECTHTWRTIKGVYTAQEPRSWQRWTRRRLFSSRFKTDQSIYDISDPRKVERLFSVCFGLRCSMDMVRTKFRCKFNFQAIFLFCSLRFDRFCFFSRILRWVWRCLSSFIYKHLFVFGDKNWSESLNMFLLILWSNIGWYFIFF